MTDEVTFFNKTTYGGLAAELGAEDTAELLDTFVEDTARKLAGISTPGVCREVLKREAHSIKSSAATLGFDRLSGLALELEQIAETTPAAQLRTRVDVMRAVFEQSRGTASSEISPDQQASLK